MNSKKPANQAGIKNGGYIGDWVLNFSLEGLLSGVFPWEKWVSFYCLAYSFLLEFGRGGSAIKE